MRKAIITGCSPSSKGTSTQHPSGVPLAAVLVILTPTAETMSDIGNEVPIEIVLLIIIFSFWFNFMSGVLMNSTFTLSYYKKNFIKNFLSLYHNKYIMSIIKYQSGGGIRS